MEEAQQILKEMMSWPTLYPQLFSNLNLRLRSGILLYGPPGCGKTLLAQTVTKTYNLNYITVKVNDYFRCYLHIAQVMWSYIKFFLIELIFLANQRWTFFAYSTSGKFQNLCKFLIFSEI